MQPARHYHRPKNDTGGGARLVYSMYTSVAFQNPPLPIIGKIKIPYRAPPYRGSDYYKLARRRAAIIGSSAQQLAALLGAAEKSLRL